VLRVWELPVERLLTGGPGVLPLAPLAAVTERELPEVIARMEERLRGSRQERRRELWVASRVLMGLRYERALVNQLLREVVGMEESDTYQEILEKGEAKGLHKGAVREARKLLVSQGTRRFGPPPSQATTTIEGLDDLGRLEELHSRLLEVGSWEELLNLPNKPQRRRKPRN
jgi:predicted transposase YdaD